ncbi:MAG: type II toxin-antitoxin system RatA family toxin [Sulfurimicrobium sp.]|jgi:ribosome-associated toxin RatA of RatAB toxin-antitoxin module|nr:type II toxin-antitoxin system RatA family toxin [Sulfurimicrobium sp.]MDO9188869.1 type II toxin-antitoxin system RatA family toxin [Sulfurimicrobium sp.]MDP1705497.1 type II toxin-antitoxin system RatA family toxin [Sulfurimicrobium sp.]MDP2199189.1 type II toxin-antitoxin system RatA family toxin [Sulfurimicrobium sp.]MDP2962808.1 type II toxin-antitoxin system RatA family toxin [Sulfurimicrobium sp.]
MAIVEKSVLVLHSAQQMFDLVDGVELYPQFLPWCGGTDVKWRDEASTVATVMIDYHRIKQSFTTENAKQIPSLIEMKLQDGPFRHLDGCWRFIALNESACKIEFRLHYEFSSKLLESLVGPVFNHITNNFVDAFVERAEKVYGTS